MSETHASNWAIADSSRRRRALNTYSPIPAILRGKMLAALERAHARGLVDLDGIDHRVGISNQHLVSMDAYFSI